MKRLHRLSFGILLALMAEPLAARAESVELGALVGEGLLHHLRQAGRQHFKPDGNITRVWRGGVNPSLSGGNTFVQASFRNPLTYPPHTCPVRHATPL